MFPALENLTRLLSSLPGIGPRSAQRIALHLIKADSEKSQDLAESILKMKREVRFCARCGALSDSELCDICENPRRDPSSICVVEEPGDVLAIEKTGEFKGRYHVLMGAISPLDGIGPSNLRISELVARLSKETQVRELVLATNPTLEGDATADYVAGLLRELPIQVTRISHGIPTGATIEYAERSTLARSIRLRHEMNQKQGSA